MFKFLKHLLIFAAASLCVMLVALHIFLTRDGKQLVYAKLVQTFNRPVTIGEVHTKFPMDLVVHDISVKGIGTCDEAVAQGGLLDVFGGSFILSRLVLNRARIQLVKHGEKPSPSGETEQPEPDGIVCAPPPPGIGSPQAAQSLVYMIPRITLRKLRLRDSVIEFVDWTTSDKGLAVTVTDFNAEFDNVMLPVEPGVISFSMSGSIPWENIKEKGWIKLKGWVDLGKKDMRATLSMKDIDGLYFYPYFSGWIDTVKESIGKIRLNFDSQITGLNNDVTMDCHMELTDVRLKGGQEDEEQPKEERMANLMLGLLKSMNQGKIALDFKIITKMDSPKFGFGVIKSAFDAKVNKCVEERSRQFRLVTLPVRIVGGTLRAAADLTSAAVNGTVDFGKSIFSTFTAPFKNREEKVLHQADREAGTVK